MSEVEHFRSTEPNSEALQPFTQAYNSYEQALQEAWMSPDIQREGAEAYSRYLETIQAVGQSGHMVRVTEAWNRYVHVAQKALAAPRIQERAPEAYQSYVHALRKAWEGLDLKTVNPPTLVAITQSIGAAVWLTAAVNGYADKLGGYPPSSAP